MEQFQRTVRLIGKDAFEALQKSRVAIYGIGGVGSFAANALCRAGIGSFYLVDKDAVDVTNINRQSVARLDTVGRDKVDVMKEDMLLINPQVKVETCKVHIEPDNIREFVPQNIDYVLDCIDNITSKVFLAKLCYNENIPIVSCMGAGNRIDADFTVLDVFSTSSDPVAKIMRKRLREENVSHLDVVWSKNPPLSLKDGERTPASISFVPSQAGLKMAEYVVKKIINKNGGV